jgi:hypothetical protein
MAYDERLAERIRRAMGIHPDITEKKMFGGLAFLKQGKMFCGVVKGELIVRVGPSRCGEFLKEPHVLSKLKVSYPIVLGDSKVSKSYGMGDLFPATFLINRTGKIREVKEGYGDKKEFECAIEKLLPN